MGNFGQFRGGQPNMQALMRQAQKMQEDAMRAQEEISETQIEGVASNGLVSIVINGDKNIQSVKISPEVVDPEDTEILEDLIMVALKDAEEKADKLKNEKMGRFGGLM